MVSRRLSLIQILIKIIYILYYIYIYILDLTVHERSFSSGGSQTTVRHTIHGALDFSIERQTHLVRDRREKLRRP